jgi:Ca-activated chloride channel homolog
MFAVRPTLFRVILVFLFTAAVGALAQTSINDVHVTPRAAAATVLAATYPADPSARLAPGSLIHASADLVLVPVTITDDRYRPVVGLDQENFQLFENKKVQEIKHFSSEDAPVSVGILLDTSGSMSYKLQRAREAVLQFCEEANPQDEFFLITFSDNPSLATDFTSRSEQIADDLLTVHSKGRTSLLDAIYMALGKMRNARYARKALLILSDGGDNHSRYTEHDVNSAIKESDVTVYAVGTYEDYVGTREEMLGPELLDSIAEQSGGHSFTLTNFNDVPEITRAIGRQLRHQYMLAYTPQTAPHDGKWHKINVKVRPPKQLRHYFLHVEARPGYYADAQPQPPATQQP